MARLGSEPAPGTRTRGAGRLVACLLAVGALSPGPPAPGPDCSPGAGRCGPRPDTVVDGFHGYRLGTRGSHIAEIDVSRPPDRRRGGQVVYTRTLRFIGVPARAYFYLDSAELRLRGGKHLIEPGASSCVRQLTTLRLMVAGTYPELEVQLRPGSGAGDTTTAGRGAAPRARCPAFLGADSARAWSVLFRNPATGEVEARLKLFRRRGQPRIIACYLNESDCVWPDSVAVRSGPKMLAPGGGRGPDTAGRRQPRTSPPGPAAGPEDERGTTMIDGREDLLVLADRVHPLRPGSPRPGRPLPDALLLRGEEVAAIGAARELESAAPDAPVLDLRGSVVTPGLVDAHLHLVEWARARREVDLSGAPSPRAAAEAVARRGGGAGEWIRGRGWNRNRFGRFPDREDLDEHVPDRPVAIQSRDMHGLWLNSEALRRLDIDADTPEPDDGRILRRSDGTPSGVLLEHAVRLAMERLPAPDDGELMGAVREAQAALHSRGFTGVHSVEMHGGTRFRSLRLLRRLRERGELRVRVLQHLPRRLLDAALQLGLRSGLGDELLRIGGVKFYLDGTLGSGTAWLSRPGRRAGTAGSLIPEREFRARVEAAAAGGLASAVHAIGDAAVETAVECLSGSAGDDLPLPPRVEHAQLIDPDRLPRARTTGLVFSVQPGHLLTDWRDAEEQWGPDRCRGAFAFQTLLDRDGILAFGSDAPVDPPDPRRSLFAATTRREPTGDPSGGWHPEQRISVREAFRAHTIGPAAAAGEENRAGRLLPGYRADLTAWDRDPLATLGRGLLEMEPVATVVGGEVAWRA